MSKLPYDTAFSLTVRTGRFQLNATLHIDAPDATPASCNVCFHCGVPALGNGARTRLIDGATRRFCCPGCEAIACTIIEQGLGHYYRLRESLPAQPDPSQPDEFAAYDDPMFQRSFVAAAPNGEWEASLLLDDVRCSACVWLIEETLGRTPGVVRAEVNYVTHRARVVWAPERARLSAILARIAAIGYRAHPYSSDRADRLRRAEHRTWMWRLFVAAFGMMQVMMYAVPVYLADDGSMTADIEGLMRWASLLLTLPVVGYSALQFFQGAWRDVRRRRLGMDVPVALGIGVAFGASVWATLRGTGQVYFDSVTMFVFALLLGRFLELRARERAGDALAYLGRLMPAFAARLRDFPRSHDAERVAVAALAAGDAVLVKAGDAVPADGIVLDGRGEVDESLLTGESRPVAKSAGSALVGGSTNLGSPLVMRVLRVGADTTLAAIVRLVEGAAAEKQPLAELADRYAHWFVLVILVIAALTAAAWASIDPERALWITVSVLVATCPCALSLATPVALTVATGEMARRGVVAARGHVIEALARATDFVFDKTGTLTEGAPRVIAAETFGGAELRACAAIAAALEAMSEHPIARAIVQFAEDQGAARNAARSIENLPGAGIEGIVDGRRFRLGTRDFCRALSGVEAERDTVPRHTEAWLGDERRLLARFALGDALKPDAHALIGALRASGKAVHLLSGDAAEPVGEVAATLGITRVQPASSPKAKQNYVRELQRRGAVVAMIGDGVNDAPVLAQADVSIAMASGAHLSQVNADAVLVSGEPAALLGAIGHARKALGVIRQNLAWAFAYNIVIIPAAAAGFVTPWLAGLGMSASSLIVVLNALRLRGRTAGG